MSTRRKVTFLRFGLLPITSTPALALQEIYHGSDQGPTIFSCFSNVRPRSTRLKLGCLLIIAQCSVPFATPHQKATYRQQDLENILALNGNTTVKFPTINILGPPLPQLHKYSSYKCRSDIGCFMMSDSPPDTKCFAMCKACQEFQQHPEAQHRQNKAVRSIGPSSTILDVVLHHHLTPVHSSCSVYVLQSALQLFAQTAPTSPHRDLYHKKG